ncbi:MAG TPA: hypothetical protein VK811_01310 [Candidatus Acidoferrum sp.]|nr:hypothetical protein [Candidatus Acidoferrum sp.]
MNEPSKRSAGSSDAHNALFATIRCVFICATIVLIVYLFIPHTEAPRRLWKPVLIDTNGTTMILPESRQLEFWTPSAKTKNYLHTEKGQVVPTEAWEVISNDDVVQQFGSILHTNSFILGYRRVEVWGQGQTTYKPGWWWTVNVFTNYTATDLARTYDDFWQSHQVLFVEVIDNRGSEDKAADGAP